MNLTFYATLPAFPLRPTATTASTLLPTTTTTTEMLPNMTDRNAQPPAPATCPDCPTLTKEHITWLNKNAMLGYTQAIAVAQAQSSGNKRIRGPGIEYVKDHVLSDFLEEFWSPADKPKTASVLLVSLLVTVSNWVTHILYRKSESIWPIITRLILRRLASTRVLKHIQPVRRMRRNSSEK